jgi:SNF2 family DNA or RNA helicase
MGMGKTLSTLTAINQLKLAGEEGPVLVLAPLRVATSTWSGEIRKWAHLRHLRVSLIVGSESERRRALLTPADVYTMNYDNLQWLIKYCGDNFPFTIVVADESTRLKNFRLRQGGVRSQALGTVAHTKIKRFINLTGTPSPNGLIDLWGQQWFVDAGVRLGRTFKAFKERWFQRSFDGHSADPLECAQTQIQAALKDVCLSVDAKDWFDLRDPIVRDIMVDLPPKARILYKNMEKEMFMQIQTDVKVHDVEAFNAASRTIKCLQLASGAAYVGENNKEFQVIHEAKLDALESIIEEAAGMPVLVAYHFKSDLARLKARFKNGRELDKDPATITDWNAGKIPVLFAHPASAGHGLNLQDGGNILAFFSLWWNLEERLQIMERIGPVRQLQAGHDRPVFIYNIMARDTVDELVKARCETKREVQDILLEAMKNRGDLDE